MSCLHVYISKFNRCQLIQFCDYCCALSFVSCHFPFVLPLSHFSFQRQSSGSSISFSFIPSRSPSTYFFVCGIYSMNVKQQTRNHRSSILVKLFVFLQRSYLMSVPHGSQRCSPSSSGSRAHSLSHSLIPLDSFYFKCVHYVSCYIPSFIFRSSLLLLLCILLRRILSQK